MRLPAVALFVFLTTNANFAAANPPPAAKPTQPKRVQQYPRTAAPAPPSVPAPAVKLVISAPAAHDFWSMHLKNEGNVPVIVTADARLLKLYVLPRGASRPRICELPPEMRPEDDLQRPLVLPPGREYAETFDPRLYCLQGADLDALAPTSVVVAHLGWSGAAGVSSPFAVAPIEGVRPEVAALKSIEAEPLFIPDDLTSAPGRNRGAEQPGLVLASVRSLDAESTNRVEIPLTLRNDGGRSVIVRFRPETLAFDVTGPSGTLHCAWPALLAAPTRELFTTLPPHGSESLSLQLSAYCPRKTFERPGLLIVRPRLDTRGGSGQAIGIRAFEGAVAASSPTLVRLRNGLATPVLTRPQLEPATAAPDAR